MDDITIEGCCADVLQDLAVIKEAKHICLTFNASKYEIITRENTIFDTILTSLLGGHKLDRAYGTLLGSPLGDGRCIFKAIGEKTAVLKRVEERFATLSAHDAFIVFQHSFAISNLRTCCAQHHAPSRKHRWSMTTPSLQSIMGKVTNTAVVSDVRAWKEASLSVKLGGLGVQSTVEVAPFAYLASLHVTCPS